MPARAHLLRAGLLGVSLLTAPSVAFAGSCPADKVVADGQGQQPGATMPKDVTDIVLGSIDLASQPADIQDRQFRLRRLAIKPGGEVPWHSHDDRPALIYIAVGQVTEYASNCLVPIVHHPGEVAEETKGTSHWWKNTGKETAVLLSADLLRKQDPDAHTM